MVSKGFENILSMLKYPNSGFSFFSLKQDAKQKASEEKCKPLVEQMEEKKRDIEKKKEVDKEQVVVGGKILIQRIRRSSFSHDSRSMFIVNCCF